MANEFVYLLQDAEKGELWGVYRDEMSLIVTYDNLKHLSESVSTQIGFVSKKILVGTNMVVEEFTESELALQRDNLVCKLTRSKHPNAGGVQSTPPEPGTFCTKLPVEIKPEVEKLKERFSVFKENFKTFQRLVDDNVISLDCSTTVPELFKDKYAIYSDIIKNKVLDEYAFSYFMDRYVPSSLVLNTTNIVSDDDDSESESSCTAVSDSTITTAASDDGEDGDDGDEDATDTAASASSCDISINTV